MFIRCEEGGAVDFLGHTQDVLGSPLFPLPTQELPVWPRSGRGHESVDRRKGTQVSEEQGAALASSWGLCSSDSLPPGELWTRCISMGLMPTNGTGLLWQTGKPFWAFPGLTSSF